VSLALVGPLLAGGRSRPFSRSGQSGQLIIMGTVTDQVRLKPRLCANHQAALMAGQLCANCPLRTL